MPDSKGRDPRRPRCPWTRVATLAAACLWAVEGRGALPGHVPGRLVLELREVPALPVAPAGLARVASSKGARLAPHFPTAWGDWAWEGGRLGVWWLLDTSPAADLEALARELADLPEVGSVTCDWLSHVNTAPNDPLFPGQWALDNQGQAVDAGGDSVGVPGMDLGALAAWDLGGDVLLPVVAVLDTGVDPNHVEFHDRLLPGFNFLTNLPGAVDDNGHGTKVASLIGARLNNQLGLAGLARNIRLLPLKVFNSIGIGSASALANALNYARQLQVDVANFSGGLGQDYEPATAVIQAAYAEGMWTVAAAGNTGAGVLEFPARVPVVLAVGAMSPCGERKTAASCDGEAWWASNSGPGLDFLAPGVRLTCATRNGGYGSDFNGSSAACAYLSGGLALLRALAPLATAAQIETALRATALDLGSPGYDTETGHGLPQLDLALLPILPRVTSLTIRPTSGSLHLSWNPVLGAVGYVVEASDDAGATFRAVAQTEATAWTTSPRELARGRRLYRVRALLPDEILPPASQ